MRFTKRALAIQMKATDYRTLAAEVIPVPVNQIAQAGGIRLVRHAAEIQVCSILVGHPSTLAVNASHPVTRQRFAIAHALGHFALHDIEKIKVDRAFSVSSLTKDSTGFTEIEEAEANIFACHLLMPPSSLRLEMKSHSLDFESDPHIERLAADYQVSSQLMLIWLVQLGLLNLPKGPTVRVADH